MDCEEVTHPVYFRWMTKVTDDEEDRELGSMDLSGTNRSANAGYQLHFHPLM